jgi:hypothetical protein
MLVTTSFLVAFSLSPGCARVNQTSYPFWDIVEQGDTLSLVFLTFGCFSFLEEFLKTHPERGKHPIAFYTLRVCHFAGEPIALADREHE